MKSKKYGGVKMKAKISAITLCLILAMVSISTTVFANDESKRWENLYREQWRLYREHMSAVRRNPDFYRGDDWFKSYKPPEIIIYTSNGDGTITATHTNNMAYLDLNTPFISEMNNAKMNNPAVSVTDNGDGTITYLYNPQKYICSDDSTVGRREIEVLQDKQRILNGASPPSYSIIETTSTPYDIGR